MIDGNAENETHSLRRKISGPGNKLTAIHCLKSLGAEIKSMHTRYAVVQRNSIRNEHEGEALSLWQKSVL